MEPASEPRSEQTAPAGGDDVDGGQEPGPAVDVAGDRAGDRVGEPAGERPAGVGARPDGPLPEPAVVRHTRLGGLWVMLCLGAAILVLLLVFVLQNGQRVEVHLYGAHWNAPLGVALLMAAALGVLLVVVPGAGRIIQLKKVARRLHRDHEQFVHRLGTQPEPVASAPGDSDT